MRATGMPGRLLFCIGLGLISLPARGASERTRITTDQSGAYWISEGDGSRDGAPSGGETGSPQPLRDSVLWQRSQVYAIYTTAAILNDLSSVAAATYLNAPKEIEYIPLEGSGTPTWVSPGTDFYTAASRDGQVIAAVGWPTGSPTATVYKWHAGSSTPDWSYQYPCANPGVARTVAVSADGSIIAVIGRTDGWVTFIIYFHATSGIPLGTYWSTSASCYPRRIALTAHGEYMALLDGSDAIVVNRSTGAERWHGTGGGSDGMAISEDGNYLAFGWSTLRMYHWNGTVYENIWSFPGGSYYLNQCAFSADGTTFAAGWYHYPAYDQNRIQLWDMPSAAPRWTYLYVQSAGSYTDLPSDIAITQSGSYIAVSSWGNEHNVNPELEVFGHAGPQPVFTIDTPGSMFDTDIVENPGGVYVVTCGKHIHANDFGEGGDLYCARLGEQSSVETASGPQRPGIQILPQPMLRGGTIRLTGAPSPSGFAIVDAAGSLVRLLECGRQPGEAASVRWDGMNSRGELVPAGVYFCRPTGVGAIGSAKLVVAR